MVNAASSKATILIVDDIPDTVQLLRDWLESHDYATIGVTNSLKALETAEAQRPDLILMDVMMPKMDGIETCRRLKANQRTSGIPVMLVTAKSPSDARAEGIMAGAVDYVTKPVNLTDLIRRIEKVLAASSQDSGDMQRLLEEVAHSALTIVPTELVWLLSVDPIDQTLRSRILTTTGGARVEMEFLLKAGNGQSPPRFDLDDVTNPLCNVLKTRKTLENLNTATLKGNPSTRGIYDAAELLRLSYLNVIPLTAIGKTPGVMVLGDMQPLNLESPRARQTLITLGTQAAIALDYSRVISDLTAREREMQQEQVFRQMILDTMSDGLAVIDAKGSIRYINRRLLRMTNYPRGYLEGRSVGDLFHPDDRIEVMVGLLREGIATMKFEQRLVTRDQRIIHVWLTRSRSQNDDQNSQVIVLSDMTVQKQREDDLERQTGRLKALNHAAHTITANLSLNETLNNILASGCQVVEAEGSSLFLIDENNASELVVVEAVGSGSDVMRGLRVPVGEGVAGWVAREARSQLVGDIEQDPRFFRGVDEQTGMNTRSLIAVPLIHADHVIGVLEVVNKKTKTAFDHDDVNLLEGLAGTAAVSIINARLFEETQRRVNELSLVLSASEAASSTLQFAQVLESIARNLLNGLHVARCTIMAWNAPKRHLESLAEISDASWDIADAPQRWLTAEAPVQRALLTAEPVVISLLDHQIADDERHFLTTHGVVSLMALPLMFGSQVRGVITLHSLLRLNYAQADIIEAQAIVESWQRGLASVNHLDALSSGALTDLVELLLKVGHTSWVTLRDYRPGESFTRLLREKGFAEWTRRQGIERAVEKYPTMQTVIDDREIRLGTFADFANDPGEQEWLTAHGSRSCMIVPLLERGTTIGLVKLERPQERLFDNDSLRLAQGIANVVSSAMENARLYQSLDSRARALESAYKELQEADKAKDQFIQNVSHELRTPLISVLGYSGLMLDSSLGTINEQQREALQTILQKGQQLTELVDDIVSIQALESQNFDRQSVRLQNILRTSLDKHQHQMSGKGLEVIMYVPDDLPLLLVDAKGMADAVDKLIDNAIKFGANGKRIEIFAQDTNGPVVQIAIRDHGIGIDPAEHQKIFRRFYQVDGGTNRRYPGTGLGLAIAKSIIEGHGGRIGVKSSLNEGATFIFTVPKVTEA